MTRSKLNFFIFFFYLLAKHLYSVFSLKFIFYSNVKMMCTLWGRYAKQVYDYSMSNMSTMIICVIRLWSVKEWKGI